MSEPIETFLENYWKERFEQAEYRFQELKSLTKNIPASQWTPEYRELAEAIHTMGRDVFYIGM